jgi:RNA recognition motif-containing protein
MKPIASTSTLSQSHSNPPPIQIHIPRVSNPKPRHVSEGVEKKKKYVELPGHTPVFCGDLSRKGTEAQLEALFSPYGTVMDVNIMRDKHTKNHLGYGFVIMESKREAQQAIDHLNQTDFQGRALRLGWGRKNRTLFIGDLDGSVTTATLCQVFSKFGELEADESLVIQGMDGLPLK